MFRVGMQSTEEATAQHGTSRLEKDDYNEKSHGMRFVHSMHTGTLVYTRAHDLHHDCRQSVSLRSACMSVGYVSTAAHS